MTTQSRDPLAGIERLLVDGNNLLGAMTRADRAAPAPALVGRLRAVVPPAIRIELIFDGPPDPGSMKVRVATGVAVRYSGKISADALLVRLVTEATPFTIEPGATILVVTDDNQLGRDLRRRGATTVGTAWLIRRLTRTSVSGPSVGAGRPPAVAPGSASPRGAATAGTNERDPQTPEHRWQPGRRATVKHGNPRRVARNARTAPDGGPANQR